MCLLASERAEDSVCIEFVWHCFHCRAVLQFQPNSDIPLGQENSKKYIEAVFNTQG